VNKILAVVWFFGFWYFVAVLDPIEDVNGVILFLWFGVPLLMWL